MSAELAYDDVYSETSRWTMTSLFTDLRQRLSDAAVLSKGSGCVLAVTGSLKHRFIVLN